MKPSIEELPGVSFIKKFGKGLTDMLVSKLNPRYNDGEKVRTLGMKKKLLPAQAIRVEAAGRLLDSPKERTGLIVGEMGVGKTLMALAVIVRQFLQAPRNQPFNVIVGCPPNLVSTWTEEIEESLPAGTYTYKDMFREEVPTGVINFTFLTYSQLRMHFHSELYAVTSFRSEAFLKRLEGIDREAVGSYNYTEFWPSNLARCPRCGSYFEKKRKKDKDGEELVEYYTVDQLQRKANLEGRAIRCEAPRFKKDWRSTPPQEEKPRLCGEILLRPIPDHIYADKLSEAYLAKKKFRNKAELVIPDEFHHLKADGVQGRAGRWLLSSAKKVLAPTGTLTGGYARDLFYLLWGLSYRELREDGYDYQMLSAFCDTFGSREIKEVEVKGKIQKRKSQMTGISAAVYEKYLVSRSVFLGLEDLETDLAPFHEHRVSMPMTDEMMAVYKRVAQGFRSFLASARAEGYKIDQKIVSKYLHATLSWPDRLQQELIDGTLVKYKEDGTTVLGEMPLSLNLGELITEMTPKDEWIINKILEEKRQGRKVLLYYTYSRERDCGERIRKVLEGAGIRVGLLRSSSVTAAKRKEWIQAKTPDIDCLMCHPALVKEGLNLLRFPTIIWAQPDYNIYELRQASRRSRRLNQELPVHVYYLYYEDCTQEQAWALIASKLESALLAEGIPAGSELFEISYSPDSVFRELVNALMDGNEDGLKLKSREVTITEEFLPPTSPALTTRSEKTREIEKHTFVKPSTSPGKVLVSQIKRRGRKRITVTKEVDAKEMVPGDQLALFLFEESAPEKNLYH